MSGLTPIPLAHFRDAIGARGSSMSGLADDIGRSRPRVSDVIWGHRDGAEIMPLIRAVVTDAEWALLCRMEHFATWNNAQCAHGEAALVWQMRVRCGWCKAPQGFKACVRAMAGKVTDGLCPDCYAVKCAEIEALAPLGGKAA